MGTRQGMIVATVLALALSACSSTTQTPAGSQADPTPTVPAPPATSPGTDPAEPTAPGATDGAGTQRSPGGELPGASPAPAPADPVGPPEPGTYRYAQQGRTTAGPFRIEPDPEGTLQIRSATAAGAAMRQEQVRTISSRQQVEQVLLFRQRGVWLSSFTSRFDDTSVECRLDEPLLAVRLPLRIGSAWSDDSTCGSTSLSITGRVVEAERRTVGGVRVDTLKIRTTLEVEGPRLQQTSRTTMWISEEHRLVVRNVERAEGTSGGFPFTSERTDRLLDLRPS